MSAEPGPRTRQAISARVLVIGAGFAGATAARRLHRQGVSVALLEARGRVGGRASSAEIGDGGVVDLGCEFVNPIVSKLAREVGVGDYAVHSSGFDQMWINGKMRKWRGIVPPLSPAVLADLTQAMFRIDRVGGKLPDQSPWTAPNAEELDSQTAEQWLEKNMSTETGRAVMRMSIETSIGASSDEMSYFHLLNYTRSLGGFRALTTVKGGSLERRFVGGAQNVVQRLVDDLGESLHLNAPVHAIDTTGSHVSVSGAGYTAIGEYVIIAIPTPLVQTIEFTPSLPAARSELVSRMTMGSAIKFQVLYSEPFWRDEGLSGQAISQSGVLKGVVDGSPYDGSIGILTCFVAGRKAVKFAGLPDRKRARIISSELERFFGPRASKPERIIEMNWNNEKYTGGCYHGVCPPGFLTKFGQLLARPTGRIYWAGAETSMVEYGAMSGAVFSGQRAADQILERIKPTQAAQQRDPAVWSDANSG